MPKYLWTRGYLWQAVYSVFPFVLSRSHFLCPFLSYYILQRFSADAIINKSCFVVHTSIENQGKNEKPARPVPREKCDAAVHRVA